MANPVGGSEPAQQRYLAIPEYWDLWFPLNHYAQHLPVAILLGGPLVSCMMFEMKNGFVRRAALDTNFISVLSSTAASVELQCAKDLTEGKQMGALVWHGEGPTEGTLERSEELSPALASIRDSVWTAIPSPLASISITWYKKAQR